MQWFIYKKYVIVQESW